jgi:glycosyltransferase involved in cell wall biosynthesis
MSSPSIAPCISSARSSEDENPFFTIAIPHYNRRRYLEIGLGSLLGQDFRDFDILISNDHSSDDSAAVIPEVLMRSGRSFRYFDQERNLGYDANVRFCLLNSRGRYVFLLGNDDCLASPDTLSRLKSGLESLGFPQVCVTNYCDWATGTVTRRVFGTRNLGSGPRTAEHFFRLFSFTSGLIFERSSALLHNTDRWDASIYVQMYLGCRIVASGGSLGGLDTVAVKDHIRLEGELVPETYRVKYRNAPLNFSAKHTGLDSVVRVTTDAISPYIPDGERSGSIRRIFSQLLTITYPYWLFEYRQLANWGMGFGVARDLWPRKQLAEYNLKPVDSLRIWVIYLAVTFVGLLFPASLFNRYRHGIASFVRSRRQRRFGVT